MSSTITFIHIVTSLILIVVVLIQHGQSDMGAVFGGSSQSVFGGSGAGTLLTKFTTGLAILFMCTSLILAVSSGHSVGGSSIMDSAAVPVKESTSTTNNVTEKPNTDSETKTADKSSGGKALPTPPSPTAPAMPTASTK